MSCGIDHMMLSPGKSVQANISNVQGALSLDLTYNNELIIPDLKLDFIHQDKSLLQNVSILNVEKTHINEQWETVNGKNKFVINEFNRYLYKLRV